MSDWPPHRMMSKYGGDVEQLRCMTMMNLGDEILDWNDDKCDEVVVTSATDWICGGGYDNDRLDDADNFGVDDDDDDCVLRALPDGSFPCH